MEWRTVGSAGMRRAGPTTHNGQVRSADGQDEDGSGQVGSARQLDASGQIGSADGHWALGRTAGRPATGGTVDEKRADTNSRIIGHAGLTDFDTVKH